MSAPILLNSVKDRTKRAFLWMHLLHEPFVVLYALLPFILRKDLGASLLQLSILSALRPTLPIFSFYWSANITNRRSNLMGAWILARISFLFIPWIDSIWYIIFACTMYELFSKSGIPALMEIIKTNVDKGERENILTLSYILTFLESIFFGFFIAGVLDRFPITWIISIAAALSLSSLYAQINIPIVQLFSSPQKTPLWNRIVNPWKEALFLLKSRSDFAQFQYGFMMGGFGLMLINPGLTILFADNLLLSHAEVVTGRSILMGLGIVISSYYWKESLKKKSIPNLTFFILIGFGLYSLFLLFATSHIIWFYFAFILYGIAQAGSHLLWQLSGTMFAQNSDSSPFSRVNILMLGIRGSIAPALGGFLCHLTGPLPILVLGSLCCFSGALYMSIRRASATSLIS